MTAERLQKVLAAAGIASRRGAEALIEAGRVTIDGRVAAVGEQVDPASVSIAVDGRPIASGAPPVYVALHKPLGVTSTVRDRHAERTVVELVPRELVRRAGRLYPVGRLDRDSEGLILLTNDGAWTERLLHPSHEVEREYAAGISRPLTPAEGATLEAGIELDEGLGRLLHLRPMTATEVAGLTALIEPPPVGLVWYRMTLAQGWKRQIRRMFAAIGIPVSRLVRVRIGTLRIGDLRAGASRTLSGREAATLVDASERRGARG
ncbi:MAG: hypothetical protein RL338_1202 [Chloroflexota bacterium]